MTPALVLRTRDAASLPARPCCLRDIPRIDARATAARVAAALARKAIGRVTRGIEYFARAGLLLVRYAFEIAVDGLAWSGAPVTDTALVDPSSWRIV